MPSPQLEDLLRTATLDGQVDSTSEFTIDTLKARHKLAESQLPSAGLWVVKMVQAAQAANATEASITFAKRHVQFSCLCPEWPWCPRDILSQLLSGKLPSEPFLFHLFAGLRGSVFEDTLTSTWTVTTQELRFSVKFSPDGTELLQEENAQRAPCSFALSTSRPRVWPGLREASVMPVKHLIRQTANEFMALYNYCWPADFELKIDGRVLPTQYRASPTVNETDYSKLSQQLANVSPMTPLPTVLACRDLPSVPGRPTLKLEWQEREAEGVEIEVNEGRATVQKSLRLEETWLRWRHPEAGACLLLLFAHEMESRVDFVCDGALVDTLQLPWRSPPSKVLGQEIHMNQCKVGLRVILPVTTDELDLSHFKVREAQGVVDKCFPGLKEIIKETARICLDQDKNFHFRFFPRAESSSKETFYRLAGYLSGLELMNPLARKMFHSELQALITSVEGF